MKRNAFCLSVSLLLLLFTGYWVSPAPGHAAATAYYKGKTLDIIAGGGVGGGTDTMARIVASVMPKHIPGNPGVVVRAMPGASGGVAANVFYAKGKPDGLHLMMATSSALSLQMKKRDIVQYDLTKFEFIGHANRGSNLLMVRKAALKRMYDPTAAPVVCGTEEGEESWMAMALWGRELLGWNIRWITGFTGAADIEMAFQRGEVDMFGTSNAFIIRRLQEEGLVSLLSQGGIYRNKVFHRRADFPDIPTFVEVLDKKKPTGIAWQAYLAWLGGNFVDKFLVAPRTTPTKHVTVLRTAFEKMSKDQKFDELMKKMVSETYDVGVGRETVDLVNEVLSSPPAALDFGRNLQIKYGVLAAKKK